MKITLQNRLDIELEYAESDSLDDFKFKKFPAKKPIQYDDKYRFVAFKVPHGTNFSISPKSRIIFEFLQVKINDSNYKGMDTYIFQVTLLGRFDSALNGGDADVDPPQSDQPIG